MGVSAIPTYRVYRLYEYTRVSEPKVCVRVCECYEYIHAATYNNIIESITAVAMTLTVPSRELRCLANCVLFFVQSVQEVSLRTSTITAVHSDRRILASYAP